MLQTASGELKFLYPEYFHMMSIEEIDRYFCDHTNRMGIRSNERHVIVSVSYTKPKIVNYLTDAKSVLSSAERNMKRNLKNYKRIEKRQFDVASKKAYSVRFEYTATDSPVEQCGELIVFRVNQKFYSIYYVSLKSLDQENYRDFQAILNSMEST